MARRTSDAQSIMNVPVDDSSIGNGKVLAYNSTSGALEYVTPSGAGDMLTSTYDPASIAEQLVGLTAIQTLTNKTLTSPILNTGVSGTAVLDEDNMASNSATQLATQQSIKAYVDASVSSVSSIDDIGDVTITTVANDEVLQYTGAGWENQTLTEAGIQGILTEGAFVDGDKTKLDSIDPNTLPTYTVAASGGDYTTIQSAIDAAATNYPQGARIFLTDEVYTITSTLVIKSNNVVLQGNYRGTELDVDGSSVTTVIKTNAPASTYQGLQIKDLSFIQTNGTAQGVCIDGSDMSLAHYDNLIIYNFGTGLKLVDTQNFTFYNRFTNSTVSANAGKCIDIDSSGGNPVNNNTFQNLRLSYGAGGTGVHLDNAQLNVFYSVNCEPTSLTGTTGIKLVSTTSDTTINNVFYSPYIEGNATGISIGSTVHRTLFFGGQVVENTTNYTDSGTNTKRFGIDINYTQYVDFNSASTTAEGIVELATGAEAVTGTDTARAVTPDALTDRMAAPGTIGGTTPALAHFTDLEITGHIYQDSIVDNGNSGTADTIDWGAGNIQKSTLTGNCTYTFTAPDGVGRFSMQVIQDATGSRTVTWPASVRWPGGTAPTLSTAANAVDIITFQYDGTNYDGVESLNFS